MKKNKLRIAILTLISNLALTSYGCSYQTETTKSENNNTQITYIEETNDNENKEAELYRKLYDLNIGLTKDGKIILMNILEKCNNGSHLHYVGMTSGKIYIYEFKEIDYNNYPNECITKYEKLQTNFGRALDYFTYEEIDKLMTNNFSNEDLKNTESRLQEQYNEINGIQKILIKY